MDTCIPEGTEPPWLSEAKEYIGIDEDDDEGTVLELAKQAGTPIQSSETAWCAVFVNAILAGCGLKTTGTMRAGDFADWGRNARNGWVRSLCIGLISESSRN